MAAPDLKLSQFQIDDADPFSRDIRELNEFVSPGVLRRYQLAIWNEGLFELQTPFQAAPLAITRSIGAKRNELWLGGQLQDGKEVWLLTGLVHEGFPIVAAVVIEAPESSSFDYVALKKSPAIKSGPPTEKLVRFRDLRQTISIDWSRSVEPELAIGHTNFAHFCWNELPALANILEDSGNPSPACHKVRVEHSTLAPMPEIFPELNSQQFFFVGESANFGRDDSLIFRAGSSVLDKRAKRRIQRVVRSADLAPEVKELGQRIERDALTTVWITLRFKNRTSTNQFEFIVHLVKALLNGFDDLLIVLNGFSIPEGALQPPSEATAEHPQVLNCRAFYSDLMERIPDNAKHRVVDLSGVSVKDAIYLAGFSSFYIAHPGTIQHKVGWFWEKSGVLVEPQRGERIANWYAKNVEDSIKPYCVDPKFFDVHPSGDDLDRNAFYEIIDVDGLVQQILSLAEPHLLDGRSKA
ncbi:hypothetical protein WNY37_18235 [Henriciella sp. AS95]|uniref:hypothetical protein n=1 Tax=Henriciella sp. AS95 TaxID=3135782 RepID=UPI00316ED432